MDGVHDLGGMHGFGPVVREENEPVFHAPWEGTVYAINRTAMGIGLYNIDEMRHGIERLPPAEYLRSTYYERWLATIERNLIEKGVLSAAEIDARLAYLREHPDAEPPRRADPALLERVLRGARAAFQRPPTGEPRFHVGDAVVTRNIHPKGHTRLPRYARDKHGTISHYHGYYVFPDTQAHGQGEQPQPVYSVAFDARELWDGAAEPRARVYLDLWESYLEPA
ncbi:MAG TPA: nitrile hydratase subunit beta [Chloroflexota bacterium]|nr:nitrile hydratase subunit beta [Chloroflexota bacterium]